MYSYYCQKDEGMNVKGLRKYNVTFICKIANKSNDNNVLL